MQRPITTVIEEGVNHLCRMKMGTYSVTNDDTICEVFLIGSWSQGVGDIGREKYVESHEAEC